jgi:PST family polysaccharide transporter
MSSSTSGVPASLAPAALPRSRASAVPAGSEHSYGQILKSSALIGGSSLVNIVVSIVRSKAMALLLGPAGVGLMGLYWSILDLTQSIAGMGINSSGVRQIAAAVGSGDSGRIARTATVLRRTSLFLGGIGAVLLILFCRPLSTWTFGSADYALPIALLSCAVLFKALSDGQAALIQGTRRIADLARVGVLSAIAGTGITVALIYFFRQDGVVPSLISVAAITLVVTWWFRRKIQVPSVAVTRSEVREEAGALLKLGSAFMVTAVLTTATAYAVRTNASPRWRRYRSCRPVSRCLDARRAVCRLHPAGDGQ